MSMALLLLGGTAFQSITSESYAQSVPQQQRTVTGTVVDATGEPVIGANITVKGTTVGTVSDMDGKYSIQASPGSVIQVSYIGYLTQEIVVGNKSVIDVRLVENQQALDEVVVVGYGTQKKVNLTGAVSSVKVDEKITNRSLTNVSSGLSVLVPGLAVSQATGMAGKNGADLKIRGLGTVNNAKPLVIVNGMHD